MIRNRKCPYCRREMVLAENLPRSRSVEHLIPNTVLTRKRTKGEGDFYACRRCNGRKSNIDYVLGVVAKAQSPHDELATATLMGAVKKSDNRAERFVGMIATAVHTPDGLVAEVPISGDELVEYIHYLGKGQFFKSRRAIYDPGRYTMRIDYVNKYVMSGLENSYRSQHKSSPFRDLENNRKSEVINDGEVIIWDDRKRYVFVFHDYTVILISLLKRSKKNMAIAKASEDYIRNSFG